LAQQGHHPVELIDTVGFVVAFVGRSARDGGGRVLRVPEILVEPDDDHSHQKRDGHGHKEGHHEIDPPGEGRFDVPEPIPSSFSQLVQPADDENEQLDPSKKVKIFPEQLLALGVIEECSDTP